MQRPTHQRRPMRRHATRTTEEMAATAAVRMAAAAAVVARPWQKEGECCQARLPEPPMGRVRRLGGQGRVLAWVWRRWWAWSGP